MKKTINSLLKCTFALVLGSSLSLSAWATTFSDVPTSYWGYDYIIPMTENGYLSGTGNGNFSPDKSMTYGEFAVVIVNGAYDGKTVSKSTDTHWADPYLNVLFDNGLMQTAFQYEFASTKQNNWQDLPLLREDAASIIMRLVARSANSTDYPTVFSSAATDNFSDVSYVQVNNGQGMDIAGMYIYDIMRGSDGAFGVGESMTRAAACVVISKLDEKGILSPLSKDDSSNSSTGTTTTPSTTPSTGTTTTTPSTPTTTSKPSDVVLGSGQYDVNSYDVPADTNKDGWITYAEVEAVLNKLEELYPFGTAWDNSVAYISYDGVRNYGCAAWAWMVSDAIFGNLPHRRVIGDPNADPKEQQRPGDLMHSTTMGHWTILQTDNPNNPDLYRESDAGTTVSWNKGNYYTIAHEIMCNTTTSYYYTRYPA